ncbi:MAG: YfhO family protein [Chloroflexi bacterium]|nr:YfhO family protein [Chloroflexota bacterium]MCL5109034.1 YfhO family protein [Chloroflexota bacterium]
MGTASLKDLVSKSPALRGWRGEPIFVLAVLVAVTGLFYYEVIFLGRTLVPVTTAGVMGGSAPYGYTGPNRPDRYRVDLGASAWAMEPWARKVSAEYAEGRFPLWNENQGFGTPLLANAQSGGMDILRLPVLFSGSSLVWDFYYLFRTLLGGVATYLFARSLGLVLPARLFFAIAYIFSGHFLFLGNNTWVEAYFLLPVVLLGEELLMLGRRRLGVAITAASVALAIYVGMPEVTLFVLLLAAGYGGWRLIALACQAGVLLSCLRQGALLVGAWIAGVALAAPLLLTLFEYVASSMKTSTGRGMYGLYYEPLAHAVVWFIPFLNGRPLDPSYGSFICEYVGTTVLVLALYGLRPTSSSLYRRIVPFTAVATVLLLAKVFGMPVLNDLGGFPPFSVTLIPRWASPVIGFGLALLAAVGVHRLVVEATNIRAVARVMLTFSWLAIAGLLLDWEKAVQAPVDQLWRTFGASFLFATFVWGIAELRPRYGPMFVGLACCVLVVLELFSYAPKDVYLDRYDRFVATPYVAYLRSRQAEAPFRIFGVDGIMFPNTSSAFGLDDIRSLDALYIDRYLLYVQNFLSPGVTDRYVGWAPASTEKGTKLLDNRWFDLTGVRYVLAAHGSTAASALEGGIADDIIAADTKPDRPARVSLQPLTVNGVTKAWLSQHPPSSVRYPVKVTPDRTLLEFFLALSPEVWNASKGDGVGFEVSVEVDGKVERLYRRDVDPKNDPSQRRWLYDSVDLSRFIGRDIGLILTTDPLRDSVADWAGWGDLRLIPATDQATGADAETQYVKVYDAEVRIYENRQALPRAFLVDSVTRALDMKTAIVMMKQPQVDPAQTAIVEGISPDQAAGIGSGGGTVAVRGYASTNVVLDVDAQADSCLVLTDSFYPGWVAIVDGREVPIYATDLAFRGVFVPKGQHVVSFSYQPTSFSAGMGLAVAAFIVLVLVAAGLVPWRWRGGRPSQAPGRPEADETPG